MPSDAIYELCTSGKSVTAAMQEDPNQVVADVARKVFPTRERTATRSTKVRLHDEYTQEDLDRAEQCGKFPYRPSDLFLRVSLVCISLFRCCVRLTNSCRCIVTC